MCNTIDKIIIAYRLIKLKTSYSIGKLKLLPISDRKKEVSRAEVVDKVVCVIQ